MLSRFRPSASGSGVEDVSSPPGGSGDGAVNASVGSGDGAVNASVGSGDGAVNASVGSGDGAVNAAVIVSRGCPVCRASS